MNHFCGIKQISDPSIKMKNDVEIKKKKKMSTVDKDLENYPIKIQMNCLSCWIDTVASFSKRLKLNVTDVS